MEKKDAHEVTANDSEAVEAPSPPRDACARPSRNFLRMHGEKMSVSAFLSSRSLKPRPRARVNPIPGTVMHSERDRHHPTAFELRRRDPQSSLTVPQNQGPVSLGSTTFSPRNRIGSRNSLPLGASKQHGVHLTVGFALNRRRGGRAFESGTISIWTGKGFPMVRDRATLACRADTLCGCNFGKCAPSGIPQENHSAH